MTIEEVIEIEKQLAEEGRADGWVEIEKIHKQNAEWLEELKEYREKNKSDNEKVYHPAHYNAEGRKECWEEMKELYGDSAVAIFDCMNAYKYYYRAGMKDGNPEEQDREKIKNYLNHADKMLSKYYGINVDDLDERQLFALNVYTKTRNIIK